MNQLTMGLLVAVGLFCFFLYNENQTLTQNNIKLEAAVEEQQRAMEVMKENFEKYAVVMTDNDAYPLVGEYGWMSLGWEGTQDIEDILDQVKQYDVYYENYAIQNGERPDALSYSLYKNPNHYWTFWLLNDHIRQQGWPLRDAEVWPQAQKYYPNKCFTTTGVTHEKELKLIEFDD